MIPLIERIEKPTEFRIQWGTNVQQSKKYTLKELADLRDDLSDLLEEEGFFTA